MRVAPWRSAGFRALAFRSPEGRSPMAKNLLVINVDLRETRVCSHRRRNHRGLHLSVPAREAR